MAITGKISGEVEIRCQRHLVFELYKHKPHDSSVVDPEKVEACHLVSGQWGVPGAVSQWHYYHDGKKETAKEIIEEVDDELHKIVFKVIEGDILDVYNSFSFILKTEDVGDKKFLIWTIEFEKGECKYTGSNIVSRLGLWNCWKYGFSFSQVTMMSPIYSINKCRRHMQVYQLQHRLAW